MNISTTSHKYYPIETVFCFFHLDNGMSIELHPSYLLNNDWGTPSDIQSYEIEDNVNIIGLDAVWLSICEQKFYSIEMSVKKLTNSNTTDISIGMLPFGILALFGYTDKKSNLLEIYKGEEVVVEDYIPNKLSISEYCSSRMAGRKMISDNLFKNGCHTSLYFADYMKQFTYRYVCQFKLYKEREWVNYAETTNRAIYDYIEECLYDGTHDKLHGDGLQKHHQAGKPQKLAIKWHIGKSEYSAYFWFEEEPIREVFDKFYGAHPDTKTDFIIRIDAENKKYELALYRYGLKEPQIIPENVYQLLVFKNKFEDYCSDNYNQERGAWIW